jgi:Holliday junction resolvase RusA-like endonuclease
MRVYQLPYPPSLNHYYRRVGPRTLISREGRTYRRQVAGILTQRGEEPMEGPLCLEVELYTPDRRRRDVDNTLKSVCDALEKGGAYHDDSQIHRLAVEKYRPVEGGALIVRLKAKETP